MSSIKSASSSLQASSEEWLAGLYQLDQLLASHTLEESAVWERVQQLLGYSQCVLFLETQCGIFTPHGDPRHFAAAFSQMITLDTTVRTHLISLLLQQDIDEARDLLQQSLYSQIQNANEQAIVAPFQIHHRKLGFCIYISKEYIKPANSLVLFSQLITERFALSLYLHDLECNQDHAMQQWLSRLLLHNVQGTRQENALYQQGLSLGIDIHQPHLVALLALHLPEEDQNHLVVTLFPKIKSLLQRSFPQIELAHLEEEDSIALLVPVASEHVSSSFLTSLRKLAQEHKEIAFVIGVSTPKQSTQEYHEAFHEARYALLYGQRHIQQGESSVFHIHDIGIARYLHQWVAQDQPLERYTQAIRTIAAYDQEHHTALLLTLEKYLSAGGKMGIAAEDISAIQGVPLHQNTVRQRIARASDLTGIDFTESPQWMPLLLALTLYHFQ